MIHVTLPLDGPDPDYARGCTVADEYEAEADVNLETESVVWTGGRVWRAGAVEPQELSATALAWEVGALSGWNTEALEAAELKAPVVEAPSGTFAVVPALPRALEARARRLGRTG